MGDDGNIFKKPDPVELLTARVKFAGNSKGLQFVNAHKSASNMNGKGDSLHKADRFRVLGQQRSVKNNALQAAQAIR